MDVNKAEAVIPVGQGGPRKDQKRSPEEEQENGDQTNGEALSGESPWAGTEAFAVGGVLAGGMSPQIQQAFEGLAQQIEPLRAEVEQARGREAHFKELAETHSFLPMPGRREFIRELTHVINNLEHLSPPPSLILLHIANADDVRRRFGRKALDAMLVHACAVIDSQLHPTDVAGSIGGNDFGIILLVANHELARTMVERIAEAFGAQGFPWQGATIPLEVVAGVASLANIETSEAAISKADKDLMGTGAPPVEAEVLPEGE
ncbi:MAG: GGDEF domain-containing protein [Rhodospirillales bacterium]|nr:GGDEF domain-containing protein [Rhodospirillales bacterium]